MYRYIYTPHTHFQNSICSRNPNYKPSLLNSYESYRSMGYGSGQRRVEIVSGKTYGCSQSYMSAIRSEFTRASHSGGATVAKPWSFGDPESKRRKRIAKYKVYAVEGKVKASLRNGIRWIKHTCSRIVYGY